ncbi:MAG TPA: heme exporter protein CcmD [Rhizomicrobium sp.]|jgi:heme exporter protein CcmD|nr:heme exporter protein CcmD [Rhizomicrobium sp.]
MSYAQYVIPAFAVSVVVLGLMIGQTLRAYAAAKRSLAALEKP